MTTVSPPAPGGTSGGRLALAVVVAVMVVVGRAAGVGGVLELGEAAVGEFEATEVVALPGLGVAEAGVIAEVRCADPPQADSSRLTSTPASARRQVIAPSIETLRRPGET